MAYDNVTQTISLPAGADLRTHQFKLVEINTSGQIVLAATAGQRCLGVLQNEPNTGEPADVAVAGISKCVAGGTIDEGDLITPQVTTASGLATSTAANNVIGRAVTPAASGQLFSLLIRFEGQVS
jgi:hypothetical protein